MVRKDIARKVKHTSTLEVESIVDNLVNFESSSTGWEHIFISKGEIKEEDKTGDIGPYVLQTLTITAKMSVAKKNALQKDQIFEVELSSGQIILFGDTDTPFTLSTGTNDLGNTSMTFTRKVLYHQIED